MARYPAAPLKDVIQARRMPGESTAETAAHYGVGADALARLLSAEEVGELAADRWAIRLGLHPRHLWGWEWDLGPMRTAGGANPAGAPTTGAATGREPCAQPPTPRSARPNAQGGTCHDDDN
jgi:hypothetical protein